MRNGYRGFKTHGSEFSEVCVSECQGIRAQHLMLPGLNKADASVGLWDLGRETSWLLVLWGGAFQIGDQSMINTKASLHIPSPTSFSMLPFPKSKC